MYLYIYLVPHADEALATHHLHGQVFERFLEREREREREI
jgi:hypothetical protein